MIMELHYDNEISLYMELVRVDFHMMMEFMKITELLCSSEIMLKE